MDLNVVLKSNVTFNNQYEQVIFKPINSMAKMNLVNDIKRKNNLLS